MIKIAICDDSQFMRGEIKKRILEFSVKKILITHLRSMTPEKSLSGRVRNTT